MKIQYILFLAVIVFTACQSNPGALKDESITSETACLEANDQYWHNNSCWNEASLIKAGGISDENMEKYIEDYKKKLEQAYVRVNGNKHPIESAMILPEGNELVFIFLFSIDEALHSLIVVSTETKINNAFESKVAVRARYSRGSALDEEGSESNIISEGKIFMRTTLLDAKTDSFAGTVTGEFPSGDKVEIIFSTYMIGGGATEVTVEGDRAILTGVLGTNTYMQIKEISDNPDISTLVLYNIPGSINDTINVFTGRLIRDAGWNTYVPKDSSIASGGVDLFASGVERIAEKGARVGIHSWCCFNTIGASDLPQEHPAHQYQLDYFTYVLGEDLGPKLYFRTLEAAPAEGMHYMTVEEMKKYNLATEIIE